MPSVLWKQLPNMLTSLRILLVPFFGWALLTHGGHDQWWRMWSWVIFAVAMITDKIDGDLARKHNLVSNFGKIADPIADKAMTGMAFIGLSIVGDVWWWVTILVLLREWSVTLLRLSVLSRIVLAADQLGKAKTMAQAIALGGLCLPLRDPDLASWYHPVGTAAWWFFELILAFAVVLTLVSGYQFFAGVWRQRGQLRSVSPS